MKSLKLRLLLVGFSLFAFFINRTFSQSNEPIPGGCVVIGPNEIINPEFELDTTGFVSALTYKSDQICNWGDFSVAEKVNYIPNNVCYSNGFDLRTIWSVTDRNEPGKGKVMIVDPCDPSGNTPCTAADPTDTRIWQQSIEICPFTEYTFSVFAKNIYANDVFQYPGANITPLFELTINDSAIADYYVDGVLGNNGTYELPQSAFADSALWFQISGKWKSNDTTSATLNIRNVRTGKDGNDLALDGIYFGLCGQAVALDVNSVIPQCTDNNNILPLTIAPTFETQNSGWKYYEWLKDGIVRESGQTITAGVKDSIPPFTTPEDNNNFFGRYELKVYPDPSPLNSCGITSRAVNIVDSCALESFPVEWLDFYGIVKNQNVKLNWATASEMNAAGYEVQMSLTNELYRRIGYVNAKGNTSSTTDYDFLTERLAAGTYYFRLKQIDLDGASTLSSTVKVEIVSNPFFLQLAPNPSNGMSTLTLETEDRDNVQIKLFSAYGQLVKTIYAGEIAGKELREFQIPSYDLAEGMYLLQVRGRYGVQTEQLIVKR